MGRALPPARKQAADGAPTRGLRFRLGGPLDRAVPLPIALIATLLAASASMIASIGVGLVALALVIAGLIGVHVVLRMLRTRGWVVVGGRGIARLDRTGKATELADWSEPFGVTVLANHTRTSCLLAFTTLRHTRFLAVRTTAPSGQREDPIAARAVLALAATVADADVMRETGAALSPSDAAELLRSVRENAEAALGRIFLSGAGGESIILENRELRCGDRVFDLRAPLEWKGFLFHESVGSIATVYQATWIRQGSGEIVLVAPLPPEISVGRRRDVQLHPALLRDLKLMQSVPGEPPPREVRVAVERVFMLPLRQALDRAPRASRPTNPRLTSVHG